MVEYLHFKNNYKKYLNLFFYSDLCSIFVVSIGQITIKIKKMTTILKNSEIELYKLGNTFFVVENNGDCIFASSSQLKAKNFFNKTCNCRNINQ